MARRRKNGTGTVRKRADGRWEGRVVTGYDDNGLPKTKNVLGKTKKECLEKLKVLQEEYTPPIRKCREDMPFGDWIAFWYETYCKPQLSYRTQVGYEDRIYKHIIPEIGQIPLNKLTITASICTFTIKFKITQPCISYSSFIISQNKIALSFYIYIFITCSGYCFSLLADIYVAISNGTIKKCFKLKTFFLIPGCINIQQIFR